MIAQVTAWGGQIYTYTGNYDQWTYSAGYISIEQPVIGPNYGPVYQSPGFHWACIGASLTATAQGVQGIANRIADNPQAYGNAAQLAKNFIGGGVFTLEACGAFGAAILAALGPAELVALCLAAGITIAMLASLIYCAFN